MEEPFFVRLSIEHYRALLGTNLAEEARLRVQRLLLEAEGLLACRTARPPAPARRRGVGAPPRRSQASAGR